MMGTGGMEGKEKDTYSNGSLYDIEWKYDVKEHERKRTYPDGGFY